MQGCAPVAVRQRHAIERESALQFLRPADEPDDAETAMSAPSATDLLEIPTGRDVAVTLSQA
jgi:hypothetical protein